MLLRNICLQIDNPNTLNEEESFIVSPDNDFGEHGWNMISPEQWSVDTN